MARSSWKGPYMGVSFQKVKGTADRKSTEKRKIDVLTTSRSSVIQKEWVGLNVGVYNGKTFVPVYILPPMVGHKFGEFSRTRVKPIHPKKNDGKKGGNPKGKK
jgi:small subunit ribosomal protein S19